MYKVYLEYLQSQKGKDISLYDVKEEGGLADFVIIQHLNSVQENKKFAQDFMNKFNITTIPEGFNRGEWIIFDLGDVIIHSFTCDKRIKYNLDKLWQNKKLESGDKVAKKVKKQK